MLADSARRRGDLVVEATIREGEGGRVGRLALADGRVVELGESTALIGRLPESDVRIQDSQASRRHAEVRPDADGYVLADLGSLNGTAVNGVPVKEHVLVDGDEITIGGTTIRFEAS
jgi:pSer/pThr/pTyr-binding forkhead associated (FHA) protein